MRDFTRLNTFLDDRLKDIYPENSGALARQIINNQLPKVLTRHNIGPGSKVLDVGIGNREALHAFRDAQMDVVGIGFDNEAAAAKKDGFDIIEEDMSFLSLEGETFDLVWCRHVIEHSLFPLFTLSEMKRLLKNGGAIYMEVPAPDTSADHESNQNHYSVLGLKAWSHLLKKAGFTEIAGYELNFSVATGPDKYFAFHAVKPTT